MNGCERNEVTIRTLQPGACVACVLSRATEVRAVVLAHLAGSTLVDTGFTRKEHWCYDAPVVPHPEATSSEWLKPNQMEENAMAKEKKARKLKAATFVETYETTSKESKTLAAKENTKRTALVYQSVVKNGPATLDEVYESLKKAFEEGFRGDAKNIRGNVRTMLRDLVVEGLVKTTKREVVAA